MQHHNQTWCLILFFSPWKQQKLGWEKISFGKDFSTYIASNDIKLGRNTWNRLTETKRCEDWCEVCIVFSSLFLNECWRTQKLANELWERRDVCASTFSPAWLETGDQHLIWNSFKVRKWFCQVQCKKMFKSTENVASFVKYFKLHECITTALRMDCLTLLCQ